MESCMSFFQPLQLLGGTRSVRAALTRLRCGGSSGQSHVGISYKLWHPETPLSSKLIVLKITVTEVDLHLSRHVD